MCMIETKVYLSSSGSEWEQEVAHPCQHATSNRLCTNLKTRRTRAGLIERKASKSSRRSVEHRIVSRTSSRREDKQVAAEQPRHGPAPRSPASSDSSLLSRAYPAAPSPPPIPRQTRHSLPSQTRSTLNECPMMSGALGPDDRAKSSSPTDHFVRDPIRPSRKSRPSAMPGTSDEVGEAGSSARENRRKVSIEVPASREYVTPKLSAPPLRHKSARIDHKRVDSAKDFPTTQSAFDRENEARATKEEEEQVCWREQESRERFRAHQAAFYQRQEAADDARRRRLEQEDQYYTDQQRRFDSHQQGSQRSTYNTSSRQRRESFSGPMTEEERRRQRQNETAAQSALRAGQRAQAAVMAENTAARRLEGERRAAAQERRDAESRRLHRDLSMRRRDEGVVESFYHPQRTARRAPIVHYDDLAASGWYAYGQRARGAEIIASEQARLSREELAIAVSGITLGDARGYDAEIDVEPSIDLARTGRMRLYRDDQRRHLDM